MHPQFLRFLRYASDALLPTHLNTNGSKIGEFEQIQMIGLGLDSIKFSFQGTSRESYKEMRNVDFFDQLFDVVRTFHRRRGDKRRPFISVSTSITDEHPSTVEVFKKRFEPYCDQLSVGTTTFDFMDLDAAHHSDRVKEMASRQTIEKRHFDPCPEVFDKLSIHANGSGHVCCNDFNGETDLGNIHHNTLEEMWTSAPIKEYRTRLAENEYEGLCTNCYDYMELTDG
jgi:radical SAM protein with 4Fe4S-binding SPASM domain